jgi:hypothetical protein
MICNDGKKQNIQYILKSEVGDDGKQVHKRNNTKEHEDVK